MVDLGYAQYNQPDKSFGEVQLGSCTSGVGYSSNSKGLDPLFDPLPKTNSGEVGSLRGLRTLGISCGNMDVCPTWSRPSRLALIYSSPSLDFRVKSGVVYEEQSSNR